MAMPTTEATTPEISPVRAPLEVLLATDGSEQAVLAAELVARFLPPGTRVELLTVLSLSLSTFGYMGELSDAKQRHAQIEEATAEATSRSREILEQAGHVIKVRHRLGNPPDEVLAEIERTGPDLVVVGRRGLGRTASLVLGSVSASLLRHSRVPVLVVP